MLLSVEGGGFFSSSASGYSKGMTLLLLGQKNEDKPMRVAPWNHCPLVDKETDPDLQLASGKNQSTQGCASFVCFRRTAAGHESPLRPKVGPVQNQEVLPEPPVCDEITDKKEADDFVDVDDHIDKKIICLKSSLKKPADNAPVTAVGSSSGTDNEHDTSCEKEDDTCQVERRKVQWKDNTGGELVHVREFEMSERGSDDEFDHGNGKTCACRIM